MSDEFAPNDLPAPRRTPPQEGEAIEDDELLYRKIPVSLGLYDPGSRTLSQEAFRPHEKRDGTGISVDRARSEAHAEFKAIDEAARGRGSKGYFVAILRAGDLRARGIRIEPKPLPDNPGHAELPQLRADNRHDNEALEIKDQLVRLVLEVQGPFVADEHGPTEQQ